MKFNVGDRVVVDSYPDPDWRKAIIGVTGTVTQAAPSGYIDVELDKAVPVFGSRGLFWPDELRLISSGFTFELSPGKESRWMNETNCAGLRSSASAQALRAEAIMAMGPVKMVKRIIALEDEITALEDEAEAATRW